MNAYTDILRRFQSEVLPAVGPRLAENIFRETLMKLPPNFGNILNQHIYKQYGPGSATLIALVTLPSVNSGTATAMIPEIYSPNDREMPAILISSICCIKSRVRGTVVPV